MDYQYATQLKARKTLFMTKSGLDNLKKKLDSLMRERFEAVKRMRAMDQKDKEDPLALANEVQRLEAAEVEAMNINTILQRAEPVTKPKIPSKVQVGSEVRLQQNSTYMTYTIVCPLEVDVEANRISEESPLGSALLEKKLHDTVSMSTRKGEECQYKIIAIK
jgi:transcription elongation factor GreA